MISRPLNDRIMNKHLIKKNVGNVVTWNYLFKKEFQTFLRVDWYQCDLEKIVIKFHF